VGRSSRASQKSPHVSDVLNMQKSRRERVLVFFPVMNSRMWRLLSSRTRAELASEGAAVEFAFGEPANAGGADLVEVYVETQAGAWKQVPVVSS
jgi:hypothetical protein